ncbi:MAG: carboxymuconolactone decarboxylase family protein [Variovorax sp.]
MAYIPYAHLDGPGQKALVERIVAERGSVLHLYQMLLHSPPVAEGWLGFMTAIRQRSLLSGALRELVIMRIALVNGADYEAEQHAPIALKEGLSQAQLDALGDWSGATVFTALQRNVLALSDAMTKTVKVPRALVDAVQPQLSHQEVVELVATIASYNMVSRFLEALSIHSDDSR